MFDASEPSLDKVRIGIDPAGIASCWLSGLLLTAEVSIVMVGLMRNTKVSRPV